MGGMQCLCTSAQPTGTKAASKLFLYTVQNGYWDAPGGRLKVQASDQASTDFILLQ